MWLYSPNNKKKQKPLQLLVITKNTRNKQPIKKRLRKKEKGTDPGVNKIVHEEKVGKKCFMRYTKLICARYAKQKFNLACSYLLHLTLFQT